MSIARAIQFCYIAASTLLAPFFVCALASWDNISIAREAAKDSTIIAFKDVVASIDSSRSRIVLIAEVEGVDVKLEESFGCAGTVGRGDLSAFLGLLLKEKPGWKYSVDTDKGTLTIEGWTDAKTNKSHPIKKASIASNLPQKTRPTLNGGPCDELRNEVKLKAGLSAVQFVFNTVQADADTKLKPNTIRSDHAETLTIPIQTENRDGPIELRVNYQGVVSGSTMADSLVAETAANRKASEEGITATIATGNASAVVIRSPKSKILSVKAVLTGNPMEGGGVISSGDIKATWAINPEKL